MTSVSQVLYNELCDYYCHSSRIRFLRFFQNPKKTRLFTFFLKYHFKKNVKNVDSVIQVFTLLHFKIAN